MISLIGIFITGILFRIILCYRSNRKRYDGNLNDTNNRCTYCRATTYDHCDDCKQNERRKGMRVRSWIIFGIFVLIMGLMDYALCKMIGMNDDREEDKDDD